jgi:hypothetical protein
MKIVCAWCTKTMKHDFTSNIVSHGICDKCVDKLMTKSEVSQDTKGYFNYPFHNRKS